MIANVKLFGASGDGTGDDTSAIRLARESLLLTGSDRSGVLYFPQGIYRLDPSTLEGGAAILLERNSITGDPEITLQGDGNGATILQCIPNVPVFRICGSQTDFVRRLHFRDFTIYGGRTAILGESWGYSSVSGMELRNTSSYAMEIRNANGSYSDSCTFDSFALDIHHNLIIHTLSHGIFLNGASLWTTLHHNTFGEDIRGFSVMLQSCRGVTVDHNRIISTAGSVGRSGIELQGVGKGCAIIGNQIDGLAEHGIEITGEQHSLVIAYNQIRDISRRLPLTYDGIYQQPGSVCEGLRILGNSIDNTAAMPIRLSSAPRGLVADNLWAIGASVTLGGAQIRDNN